MLLFEVIMSVFTMYMSIYWIERDRNIKFKKYLINIIITILICYVVAIFIRNITIAVYFICALININHRYKNKLKTIFMVGVSIIINIFAIYLCSYIEFRIVGNSLNEKNYILILFYFLILLIVFFISKIVSVLCNIKQIDFYNKNNYLKFIIAIITVFVSLIIYNITLNSSNTSFEEIKLYSIFLVIMSMIIIFIVTILIRTYYKAKELEAKKQELKQLQCYLGNIEKYYGEMRKFKHDYVNIISTLAGFMEEKDLDGLEKYFEKNIAHITNEIESDFVKLKDLSNIKVTELKGLLIVKSMQAQQRKIDISLEVIEEVNKINWDTVEMARCIGILLDNAIDAVNNNDNKKIQLAIFNDEDNVTIIIQNYYCGEKLSLQQIYKKGFSTKGKNRGIGLATIKEIVDNNNKIDLETKIDNNKFTQVLRIYN